MAKDWKDRANTVWTDGSRLDNGRMGAGGMGQEGGGSPEEGGGKTGRWWGFSLGRRREREKGDLSSEWVEREEGGRTFHWPFVYISFAFPFSFLCLSLTFPLSYCSLAAWEGEGGCGGCKIPPLLLWQQWSCCHGRSGRRIMATHIIIPEANPKREVCFILLLWVISFFV